jgi:phosphatidylserine/phosphatidylglycerophosphate/cardiolipin synthase-like enzyme
VRRLAIVTGGLLITTAVVSAETTAAGAAVGPPLRAPAVAKPVKARKKKPVRVPQGPRFNRPSGNLRQQGSIDLYIKKLIEHAAKGSEIDLSLFRLNTSGMAKALAKAKRRGVKVRIVLDHAASDKHPKVLAYLKRNLGTNKRKASWVDLCPKDRGCIAPAVPGKTGDLGAKNHNKFYAFSHTYDSRNVVVQTSGNASAGMYAQWNDAITATDRKIYNAYRGYFYALARHRTNGDYYRVTRSGGLAVSFFPKATGDPIVSDLDKVRCTGGTRIRLSSGIFDRATVARKLSELDDAGCQVQVVSGSFGGPARKELSRGGAHGGAEVRFFDHQKVSAHSKYLLIDGYYDGRRRKVVMTGSHSYTNAALRHNDEAMFTVRNAGVHDAYVRNFNQVFGSAKGRLRITPWLEAENVPTAPDGAVDDDG